MRRTDKCVYEFDRFRLNADAGTLEFEGSVLALPQRYVHALLVLIDKRGEVVGRDALLNEVWNDTYVDDANLSVAVSALRKVLSQCQPGRNYIETVPRRGYRFAGDVTQATSDEPVFTIDRREIERVTIVKTRSRGGAWVAACAIACAVLAAAVAFGIVGDNDLLSAIAAPKPVSPALAEGRRLLDQRRACESVPHFREAVSTDPDLVEGHASLGVVLGMCDVVAEADKAVGRALELDPGSSRALAADGFLRMFRKWDWAGAEAQLRRAIAADPANAEAHHWLAVCLSIQRRTREALGEISRAIELKPASALFHADKCQIHYFESSAELALRECRTAAELDPALAFTQRYLRDIYHSIGDEQLAFDAALRYAELSAGKPIPAEKKRQIFENSGYRAVLEAELLAMRTALEKGRVGKGGEPFTALAVAELYADTGDMENAIQWLGSAAQTEPHSSPFMLAYIAVDPRYAPIRTDPRFRQITERMGLAH